MKVSVIGNGNVGMALFAYLKNFRKLMNWFLWEETARR